MGKSCTKTCTKSGRLWNLRNDLAKPLVSVGARVKFAEERNAYTVQAAGKRFAVCTKPFNPQRTVTYSIIDWNEGVRGTENLIFCFGFETRDLCIEALQRLESGETEVSHRNRVPLKISWVKEPK